MPVIYTYAGSSDRPLDPDTRRRRDNQIRLGGVYGESRQRYAVATDVPGEMLSAAARRMIEIMEGDFTGGPIRLGMPRMMVRRRRIGIAQAATMLGYPQSAAQPWIDCHGESVEEAIVREDLSNFEYPNSMNASILVAQINRLARRPGLVVVMPAKGGEVVIDAAAIDETMQADRWKHLLSRSYH